jgi:flagellar protein FlaG
MSVTPSGVDLGLTNLTPELTRSNEISTNNAKVTDDNIAEKNQPNLIEETRVSVDKVENKEALTPEQLEKVAQQLQNFVGEMNRGLEFSVDKDSGRDVIRVVDKSTGDLVKQFPSEEVLTLVAKLSEMVGGFIDAKV